MAEQMSQNNVLNYSNINDRNWCGENIAGPYEGWSVKDIRTLPTDTWYSEIRNYCWETPGFGSYTAQFT